MSLWSSLRCWWRCRQGQEAPGWLLGRRKALLADALGSVVARNLKKVTGAAGHRRCLRRNRGGSALSARACPKVAEVAFRASQHLGGTLFAVLSALARDALRRPILLARERSLGTRRATCGAGIAVRSFRASQHLGGALFTVLSALARHALRRAVSAQV